MGKLIVITLLEIILGAILGELVAWWLRNWKERLEAEPLH